MYLEKQPLQEMNLSVIQVLDHEDGRRSEDNRERREKKRNKHLFVKIVGVRQRKIL